MDKNEWNLDHYDDEEWNLIYEIGRDVMKKMQREDFYKEHKDKFVVHLVYEK